MHQLKKSLGTSALPSTAETSIIIIINFDTCVNNITMCVTIIKIAKRVQNCTYAWWSMVSSVIPANLHCCFVTPKRQCCAMDQKSNFQSLISFTKYLRDTKEEINKHLPQGLIPKALSLFTVGCYRPRIKTAILFRIIINFINYHYIIVRVVKI